MEWRTRGFDGTNNTLGLTAITGLDFEENIGLIKMKAGEKLANISVKIFDNKKPELTKSFLVELKNPSMAGINICLPKLKNLKNNCSFMCIYCI